MPLVVDGYLVAKSRLDRPNTAAGRMRLGGISIETWLSCHDWVRSMHTYWHGIVELPKYYMKDLKRWLLQHLGSSREIIHRNFLSGVLSTPRMD
jgi:hypothetical protein